MFYKVKIKDHIRVAPELFGEDVKTALLKEVKAKYEGFISKDLGFVVDVLDVSNFGEGVVIPGDGAAYYHSEFELLTFNMGLQEVLLGRVKDLQEFGAFLTIGPIEGMIHISQTMDDFVSFSKDKVLLGKDTKRSLKVSDLCRARVIAVSFKDQSNPKIGLTMRQPGLGKLDWIEEDLSGKPKAKSS
ncbi:DNA-directed RNA polymerase [Candidatus Woesearchaeota archaeon]|nr:DNA-directed RNA polymerase [Candidatus Woesearchaeota archaeon]